MLKLRTDTKYVTPDGRLTQAGYEALQSPIDDINARLGSSLISLQTAATASGTAINFTGIPAWARRVTVMGIGLSTNGTSPVVLRVGDGAIVATGYLGALSALSNTLVVSSANETTGCLLTGAVVAASVYRFICHIERISGNTWVFAGNGAFSNAAGTVNFASEIALTNALDRLRITTLGGTDTFDAGSVNISWE